MYPRETSIWSADRDFAIEEKYHQLIADGYSVELVVTSQDQEIYSTSNLKLALNRFEIEERSASPMKKVSVVLVFNLVN